MTFVGFSIAFQLMSLGTFQLNALQHEFVHLRDGNGLAPYFVDIAGLIGGTALLPTNKIGRGICSRVIGMYKPLFVEATC